MSETENAGDQEKVAVRRGAVDEAVRYLSEVGRLDGESPKSPKMVGKAILRSVTGQWGTAKVPRVGDGWLVDLSDALGGEVLYARVERHEGKPVVVAVQTNDEVHEMWAQAMGRRKSEPPPEGPVDAKDTWQDWKDLPSQAQMGIDPEAPNGPTLVQQRDTLREQVAKQEETLRRYEATIADMKAAAAEKAVQDDQAPALLLWEEDEKPQEQRVKMVQVPGEVQALMQRGIKPGNIEVWSRLQVPKVKIELS
jgi:hypothetical protein